MAVREVTPNGVIATRRKVTSDDISAIAGNADKRADQRLSGGVKRGETHHLTGGRAGQTQGGETGVAAGCGQSCGGTGERHERHDEQHAGEYRQRHIGGGELGQARRVADLPFPRGHRIGPAGTEVERAGDGMIGRSPPDETVYAAEHGEEDGGGCGEGDDCQHRGVAGAAAQAGAVKQPPEGERAHRAPPAVVSLPPAGAAERSEAEGGSAPSGHPQSACG